MQKVEDFMIEDLVDIMLEIEENSDDEARLKAVESFRTYSQRLIHGMTLLMAHPVFASFLAAGINKAKTDEEILQTHFGITDEQMGDMYEYGASLYREAKYKDASDVMYCLCLFNPFVAGFWRALGLSQEGEKDYRAAVLSYAIALEKDDDLDPALFTARCLGQLGLRAEALETLDHTLTLAKEAKLSQDFFKLAKDIRYEL